MSSEAPAEQQPESLLAAEETVDAVPVLAEVRALEPARRARPAVQAAAVAATGFVVGAATVVAVHRRLARGGPARPAVRRKGRAAAETLTVLGTRSFLVDVHLLGRAE